MNIRSKIFRDTAVMTIMQIFLDSASLVLNSFITRQLGAAAIGTLTLIGSFLGLAGIVSSGNAYLCSSRMISEEIGKRNGNPEKILWHGVKLCLILCTLVSAVIVIFAEPVSRQFFHSTKGTAVIRKIPVVLFTGAVGACLKGYFNANRKTTLTAVCDTAEFIVKSVMIVILTLTRKSSDESAVFSIMTTAVITGNSVSFAMLFFMFLKNKQRRFNECSVSFQEYIRFAVSIMFGGVLTAVLSSTNDAVIPYCLRQYGNSPEKALGSFGVFEAIVIPSIFFPSVVLCSMSGIIVRETARAKAENNILRIKSLAERLVGYTLVFSVFTSAVLMRFGNSVGELLGGNAESGKLITVIAPVIPFIYLEIVLEAVIKGTGQQTFSTLNYLAEYVIRIAVVLIFVPHFALYGVVASYYTSNVFGNCSRLLRIIKTADMKFRWFTYVIMPVVYSFLTMSATGILLKPLSHYADKLPYIAVFIILWGTLYAFFIWGTGEFSVISQHRTKNNAVNCT